MAAPPGYIMLGSSLLSRFQIHWRVTTVSTEAPEKSPLVTGNTRLTRLVGRVLFWLVILQFFSAFLFFGLDVNWRLPVWIPYGFIRAIHFSIGFTLIPLVILKLMTTSWKAGGYYVRRPIYKK